MKHINLVLLVLATTFSAAVLLGVYQNHRNEKEVKALQKAQAEAVAKSWSDGFDMGFDVFKQKVREFGLMEQNDLGVWRVLRREDIERPLKELARKERLVGYGEGQDSNYRVWLPFLRSAYEQGFAVPSVTNLAFLKLRTIEEVAKIYMATGHVCDVPWLDATNRALQQNPILRWGWTNAVIPIGSNWVYPGLLVTNDVWVPKMEWTNALNLNELSERLARAVKERRYWDTNGLVEVFERGLTNQVGIVSNRWNTPMTNNWRERAVTNKLSNEEAREFFRKLINP